MASFIIGALYQIDSAYYIGLGILFYGIAYFLVHEVLIHNRFRRMRIFLFNNVNNYYLKTIIYAHRMHHKHIEKEDGESFGMLIVNPQYFKVTKEKLNRI